jgi:hypothetical protein
MGNVHSPAISGHNESKSHRRMHAADEVVKLVGDCQMQDSVSGSENNDRIQDHAGTDQFLAILVT